MIRKLLVLAALLLVAAPATALAGNSTTTAAANASKQCTALKAKIGLTSFGQAFTSFGACVSTLTPLELQNSNSAATACRSERADVSFAATHSGKTFAQFYAAAHPKNAFGNCVALKSRSASAAQLSAARTCASQRADANFAASHGGKTFAQVYATNAGDANAFGKCVSQKGVATVASQPVQPQPPVTRESSCGPDTGYGQPKPMIANCIVAKSNG